MKPAAPARVPAQVEARGERSWRTAVTALRPHPALAALLVLTGVLGLAWAFVTPAFQAPDENAHFGYVQSLGEGFSLPGDPDRPRFTTEQATGSSVSNADQAAAQLPVRMEWSRDAYERSRRTAAEFPRSARTDGGGANPASSNPPLYYLYEAGAYRLGEGGDLFTRLEFARIASVLWILATVAGVWLLAGEVFDRDRSAQVLAAGCAGLSPMLQFVSASVNPDAMLYACWSAALWLGARLIRRGLTPGRVAALFAMVGIACTVKATSYALIPPALLALAIAWWRSRGAAAHGLRWRAVGAAAGGLVLTIGLWFVVAALVGRPAAAQVGDAASSGHVSIREFVSYVWQFYLPRLPFMTPFGLPSGPHPVYDVWVKTGWAAFGWLEVRFPGPVYKALAALTLLVAAAAVTYLWRRRRTLDRGLLAFFALVVVTLVAGLHWSEYHLIKSGAGPFNVGRYLLPLAGLAGLAVVAAVRCLPSRFRLSAAAVALSSLFVLNVFSLGLMMERFYA